MAWKETERAAAVMFRRRFACDECHTQFEDRVADRTTPPPDCPTCVKAGAPATPAIYIPPKPAIGTFKAKVIDYTQRMAEEDYGLTDMNDNQRPGDIAFKPDSPVQTAQLESEIRQWAEMSTAIAHATPALPGDTPNSDAKLLTSAAMQRENYWQGHQGETTTEQSIGASAAAKAASDRAREQGVDPIGILERGRETGMMAPRYNVVASCTEEEAKGG